MKLPEKQQAAVDEVDDRLLFSGHFNDWLSSNDCQIRVVPALISRHTEYNVSSASISPKE
jgi:hypothetical protein